ncbi:hypothetical protein HPB47_018282 [Ixodes persulcatus]|uniref:Uncharacterized protein n=1 Tax=Ixodes persulcatus TaxID=34615 RepID=A0AC60QN49_IXOPE|nr:hypothetical protein HPB47_018282 [Ixodes persulcatus]
MEGAEYLELKAARARRGGPKEIASRREQEARRKDTNAARDVARTREEAECRLMELKIRLEETHLKLQEAQNAALASFGSAGEGTLQTLGKSPQSWLATFDEGRDDLDASTIYDSRKQWATALSLCLNGEALGVISKCFLLARQGISPRDAGVAGRPKNLFRAADVGRPEIRQASAGASPNRCPRHTGSNTAVARRRLVTRNDLMGKWSRVYLVDCTVSVRPEEKVQALTPFFTGETTVKCMKNPRHDVILGNIRGVRAPEIPDLFWSLPKFEAAEEPFPEKKEEFPSRQPQRQGAKCKKKNMSTPLLVPSLTAQLKSQKNWQNNRSTTGA